MKLFSSPVSSSLPLVVLLTVLVLVTLVPTPAIAMDGQNLPRVGSAANGLVKSLFKLWDRGKQPLSATNSVKRITKADLDSLELTVNGMQAELDNALDRQSIYQSNEVKQANRNRLTAISQKHDQLVLARRQSGMEIRNSPEETLAEAIEAANQRAAKRSTDPKQVAALQHLEPDAMWWRQLALAHLDLFLDLWKADRRADAMTLLHYMSESIWPSAEKYHQPRSRTLGELMEAYGVSPGDWDHIWARGRRARPIPTQLAEEFDNAFISMSSRVKVLRGIRDSPLFHHTRTEDEQDWIESTIRDLFREGQEVHSYSKAENDWELVSKGDSRLADRLISSKFARDVYGQQEIHSVYQRKGLTRTAAAASQKAKEDPVLLYNELRKHLYDDDIARSNLDRILIEPELQPKQALDDYIGRLYAERGKQLEVPYNAIVNAEPDKLYQLYQQQIRELVKPEHREYFDKLMASQNRRKQQGQEHGLMPAWTTSSQASYGGHGGYEGHLVQGNDDFHPPSGGGQYGSTSYHQYGPNGRDPYRRYN